MWYLTQSVISLFKGTFIFGKTSLFTKESSTETLRKNVLVCFSGPFLNKKLYFLTILVNNELLDPCVNIFDDV